MSPPFVGQSVPRVDGAPRCAARPSTSTTSSSRARSTARPSAATSRAEAPRHHEGSERSTGAASWSSPTRTSRTTRSRSSSMTSRSSRSDEIRHCYEPVALVACEDPCACSTPWRPSTSTSSRSLRCSRSRTSLDCTQVIYGKDNVQKRYLIEHELAQPIEQHPRGCDVVLSGRYRVHHQEQLYIEPQGMVAWWDCGRRARHRLAPVSRTTSTRRSSTPSRSRTRRCTSRRR